MAEAVIQADKLPIKCPICLDTYTQPRTLPCLHTFCTTCLQAHISNVHLMSHYSLSFPCPVCRNETRPPMPFRREETFAELFPMNHLVVSLIDDAVMKNLDDVTFCTQHPDCRVSMFCRDHKEVCCPTCVAKAHRKCDDVTEIESILEEFDLDKEQESIIQHISDLENLATDHEAKCAITASKLEMEIDKVKRKLQNEKEKLLDHIEDLEEKACADVDEKSKSLKETIAREKEFAMKGKETCSSALLAVKERTNNCNKLRTFIQIQQTKKTIESHFIQQPRPELSDEITFKVNFNKRLSDLNNLDSFASIRLETSKDDKCVNTKADYRSNHFANVSPNVETRSKSHGVTYRSQTVRLSTTFGSTIHLQFVSSLDEADPRRQWVSGVTFIDHRMLIMCNQTKASLCLIRESRLVHEDTRPTAPWDVTYVQDARIAVTYPQERLIRIFDIHCSHTFMKIFGKPSLSNKPIELRRTIVTEGACYGIATVRNNFIVACEDRLMVFNHTGNCLKTIKDNNGCGTKFKRLVGIAVDNFRHTVYVTDEASNCVYFFEFCKTNFSELPTSVYTHEDLKCPQGIAINSSGQIFVCAFVSKNIHLITPSGETIRIIPTLQRPYGISIESKHSFLILTFYPESDLDNNAPVLHLYKLAH
ncbi:hypothetical protein DPMN_060400 [Dreissena polymorpha]|uniref:RING-type domain-containing protein n=1 Tax=Dreissena polymorpha TaxID=45954 RepID=A0A9D4C5M6_DREPO|nr:hypothetical protein DPMN_060400 [Dreissena polymorpha]